MQLEHSFSIPVGVDEAWPILIDIERIGPCMPGAAIDSVDGDDFTGTVKVKLGPINLTYKGKASFIEKDEAGRRAVIDARGRDARGNGTAAAKITATLHDDGGSTLVRVRTDLDITGKPAQFGRGVMVDVGNKLLGQFADSLARTLEGGEQSPAAAPAEPPAAEPPATAPAKRSRPKPAATSTRPPAEASEPSEPSEPAGPSEPAQPAQPAPAGAEAAAMADSAQAEEALAAETAAQQDAAEGVTEGAAETTPAYAVPGGLPAEDATELVDAVPAARFRPEHEVEPIDLLHHAGPAVAKRLAPVAVALVVVLIAVRRRRHNRG